MRYLTYLTVLLFVTGLHAVQAQTVAMQPGNPVISGNLSAEDSIKTTVNQLFTAMKEADPLRLRTCFADSAILQTLVTDKSGRVSVRNEGVEDFAAAIGKLPKGAADEQIRIEVIKVDEGLAIVWAPYTFYYNGRKNHCGVDSFQLIRVNGGWKIQYIIDTRRKEPCS